MSLLIPTPNARIRPVWWIPIALIAARMIYDPFSDSMGSGGIAENSGTAGYLVGPVGYMLVAALLLALIGGWTRPTFFEARRTAKRWLILPAGFVLGAVLLLTMD